MSQAIDYFSDRFQQVHGRRPRINGAKDGALLRGLLRGYDLDQVKAAIDAMLADVRFGRARASVGLLVSQWDAWVNASKGAGNGQYHPAPAPDLDVYGTVGTGAHAGGQHRG